MNDSEMKNKWEITDLLNEISMNLDLGKYDEVLDAFSEDAVFTIIENGLKTAEANGKEELKKLIATRTGAMSSIFHLDGTRMATIHSLDQAATAKTNALVKMEQKDPAASIEQYQRIEDNLIKVNGYWYVVQRTITIISKSAV